MNVNAHEIQCIPIPPLFVDRLDKARISVILFIAIINKVNLSLLLNRRSVKVIISKQF